MPGLFDSIKQGAFGIFAGPGDPRTPEGTGRREGLVRAGLATIVGANSGQAPLEALAGGALAGQEAAKAAQADYLKRQNQAQLQTFLRGQGFDRNGLTRTFFQMLSTGDIEGAKSISEIIKSLPDDNTVDPRNRQQVDTVVSAAAGAPPEIVARLGEGTNVDVQRDALTGAIFWESAVPKPPPAGIYERVIDRDIDGVAHNIGILRQTGQEVDLGAKAQTSAGGGGTGGAEERRRRLLGGITNRNLELAFSDPEGLSNVLTGTLARWSEGRGVGNTLAREVLGRVRPQAQQAQAGRQMVMATLTPLLSGAAMTDREREFYGTAFTIQEGDLPQTQLAKQAAVTAMAEAFAQGILLPEGPEATAESRAHNSRVMQQIMQDTLVNPSVSAPGAAGATQSQGAAAPAGVSPFADLVPR